MACGAWGEAGGERHAEAPKAVARATQHRCGGRVRRGAGSRSVVPWSGGVWWGGGWRGVKARPGANSRAQQGRAGDGCSFRFASAFSRA